MLRDGSASAIAGREVVRGDVVLLAEGDRVPADAVLVQCVNLSVDESALTGESVPVRKSACAREKLAKRSERPGGDATPWVFSGTLVVKGQGIALVKETGLGDRARAHRQGADARSRPSARRCSARSTASCAPSRVLGLGAAALVVVVYGLTRGNWLEGLLAGIATAMAMLPEEFPVVLTVFLALGAWRLSQKHVLTRRSPAIETLGSATVLCVDKTGTLTHEPDDGTRAHRGRRDVRAATRQRCPSGSTRSPSSRCSPRPIDPFDPMDTAFKVLGERYLVETEHLHSRLDLVREYPLSEHLLALSHVWRSP